MKQIVGLLAKELTQRCQKQLNIELLVRDGAKNYIVEKAYEPKYGARPLRRKLQNEVEDRLAELLLDGTVKAGMQVIVTTRKNEIAFDTKQK